MRKLTAMVFAAALAGCVAPGPSGRELALSGLIGQNESAAVQLLGVPDRSFETEGKRYLSFSERRLAAYPGLVPFGGYYRRYHGFYSAGFYQPEFVERGCETTLEIVDGKVASFALRGNACW
jgi:hypothetical protein